MSIENNPIGSPLPSQSFSQTYVQTPKNRSVVMWVVALLLVLTIMAFGTYVYYNQRNANPLGKSDSEESLVFTGTPVVRVINTESPSVNPSPIEKYESISVDVPGVDDSVGYTKYSFSKPVSANWSVKFDDKSDTESKSGFIIGDDFTLIIKGEYEDESYGQTPYLEGFQMVNNANYGSFYRVRTSNLIEERGNDAHMYVGGTNFVKTGFCQSIYAHLEGVPAPCGDSMLNIPEVALLSIYCIADDTNGLNECDKIVGSLKKV